MTLDWAACALIMASASLVMGLAGFGIALVAMAFLPYFMLPETAIVVLTIYTIVFVIVIFVPVRRHVAMRGVTRLLVGTVLGILLFKHVDHVIFRRVVFAVLLVSGLVLLARG